MKKVFQIPLSCLASTSFIIATACSGGGGGDGQQPQPSSRPPSQSGSSGESGQSSQQTSEQTSQTPSNQTAANENTQQNVPSTSAPPTEQSPESKAPIGATPTVPPPTTATPNAPNVARVINPDDDATILLAKYLMEVHPDAVDASRGQIVNEIFSDEDLAQAKILEIQAAVARLAKNGLYTSDVKSRVAFLQNSIQDRIQQDQYYGVLQKGVFVVATGAALGTLAGSGFFPYTYQHLPEAVPAIRSSVNYTTTAVRDKMSALYKKTADVTRELKATVSSRERLNALVDKTREGFHNAVSSARAPFKSAEEIVKENLNDLGFQKYDQEILGELTPVKQVDLPDRMDFQATPKSNFQYAVLDTLHGEPLGIQRIFAFKQERLVRGSPFETVFITQPIEADLAGSMASRLAARADEPPARQFVHFQNLKTGTVSALRWPATKFKNMLESAGQKIQPLYHNMDMPTTIGTAALGATGFGLYYWKGYDNGEKTAQQYDAVNLEGMIQEKRALTSSLEGATK